MTARSSLLVLLLVSVALLGGCAFPRRGTSLSAVRSATAGAGAPPHFWALTLVGAEIPPLSRGALAWDGSDGLPDAFVRLYRDDELVWESSTVNESRTPAWNVSMPRNFYAPPISLYRFELWDRDEVGADPIGILQTRGLPPSLVTEADTRLMLEGGAQLELRLTHGQPHSGIGLPLCELRGDGIVVLEVETYSPAGRAGIRAGDVVVAVGAETVSQLGSVRAMGALSMAAERDQALRVRDPQGAIREVRVDREYTWLSM